MDHRRLRFVPSSAAHPSGGGATRMMMMVMKATPTPAETAAFQRDEPRWSCGKTSPRVSDVVFLHMDLNHRPAPPSQPETQWYQIRGKLGSVVTLT